jgi:hypothetical protein
MTVAEEIVRTVQEAEAKIGTKKKIDPITREVFQAIALIFGCGLGLVLLTLAVAWLAGAFSCSQRADRAMQKCNSSAWGSASENPDVLRACAVQHDVVLSACAKDDTR